MRVIQFMEECDDGNSDNTDYCTNECRLNVCGDGYLYVGVEECDDGNDVDDDGCTNMCKLPRCGDGIVQEGEECDDGNLSNMDDCLNSCLLSWCGDGFVHAGEEECDDGNLIDTDACLSTCVEARCGDGIVWEGVEECDDGNSSNNDACLNDCGAARCGDGFVWEGVEGCDDGNLLDGDGCPSDCMAHLGCYDFDSKVASNKVDTTIVILGGAMQDGMRVILENVDTGDSYDLGLATVSPDKTSASVNIPAGAVPRGLYNVVLLNPDGNRNSCPEYLRVTDLWPPSVSDVIPSVAWAGVTGDGILSDERVTITGAHFRITPTVRWTLTTDPSVSFDAPMVNWISEGEITALCPSESMHMPVGFYYVDVINPEGLSGRRSVLFEVSDIPPPMIMDIDPERGAAADNITMTVTGRYFQEGAVVSFENADGTRTAVTTTFISSDELRCFIPGGTLAQGLHPVWVTNPDGREDVFYSYNATSSAAGHFNQPFELTPELLNTGRERHGSVFGCDDFGSSYIYVAGGVDSAKNVLSDTEFSEVSIFGNNSLWRQVLQYGSSTSPRVVSSMNVPREGFALVRYGKFLYAIGGAPLYTNVSTPPVIEALGSIERAFILGYETMPRIRLPVVHGGSGLPLGTWYYQVSAIGPWGESLGSKEVQARNANGVIDVCWGAVTGATSYNIYRSPAADGRAGTTRLLAVEVVGGCYTDDGRGVNQPAPGRLRGAVVAGGSLSTGWWVYRVTAVVGGRETVAGYREYVEITDPANGKVELRWDPVPGATFNLYRSQTAIPSVSGDEQSYLLVSGVSSNSYVDDGSSAVDISRPAPDGIPPLPPGTLSRWELLISPSLVSPREGLSAAIITVPSGSETVDDKTYLYVVGGRPDNSGTGYYDTVEKSEILPDGSLGGFIVEGSTLNTARAFLALTTTWNRDDTPVCPPPVEPPCEDLDGDGHDAEWCGGDDCNDYDSTIYPGAPEICEDGIDQDCDGADTLCDCTDPSFADQDGDGHLRLECEGDDCCDSGYEPVIGCDPSTASQIYPGATEICENGIDEDCDGCDPLCACSDPSVSDSDGDGYIAEECCGDDCDDTDPNIHPGATEILCNGIDENCDGFDPCFELFMMELPVSLDFRWNRWVVARFGSGFVSIPRPEPSRSVGTEPIYLVASQGDDVFTVSNTGLIDFEVSKVTSPDGLLAAWTTQVNSLPQEGELMVMALCFTLVLHSSFPELILKAGELSHSPRTPLFQGFRLT